MVDLDPLRDHCSHRYMGAYLVDVGGEHGWGRFLRQTDQSAVHLCHGAGVVLVCPVPGHGTRLADCLDSWMGRHVSIHPYLMAQHTPLVSPWRALGRAARSSLRSRSFPRGKGASASVSSSTPSIRGHEAGRWHKTLTKLGRRYFEARNVLLVDVRSPPTRRSWSLSTCLATGGLHATTIGVRQTI